MLTNMGWACSLIPPPNTHTPAIFDSPTTACATSETAGKSSAGIWSFAALGNEIKNLVINSPSRFYPLAFELIFYNYNISRSTIRLPLAELLSRRKAIRSHNLQF